VTAGCVPSLDCVQTFLPYPDFEASARALDQKRLGKQRVETIQVVRALTVAGYGWANHPATLMWKGYEEALGRYGFVCCEVWLELGFGDTCAATIAADLDAAGVGSVRTQAELAGAGALPPWPAVPRRARRPPLRVAGPLPRGRRGRTASGGERRTP
jgi:hypothetical protein